MYQITLPDIPFDRYRHLLPATYLPGPGGQEPEAYVYLTDNVAYLHVAYYRLTRAGKPSTNRRHDSHDVSGPTWAAALTAHLPVGMAEHLVALWPDRL